jgi:hypothetical protein
MADPSTFPTPTNLPIDIRLGTTNDLSFILSSWTIATHHIYPNQYSFHFNENFNNYLRHLINQSVILIAHLPDQPQEILSYLVYTSFRNNLVIHFAYTKLHARRQKIVSRLIQFSNPQDFPIVFTHAPKSESMMISLCEKHVFYPNILSSIQSEAI